MLHRKFSKLCWFVFFSHWLNDEGVNKLCLSLGPPGFGRLCGGVATHSVASDQAVCVCACVFTPRNPSGDAAGKDDDGDGRG